MSRHLLARGPIAGRIIPGLPGHRLDESGAVALLAAIMVTVLFGLAAIVIDLGLARDVRRQAQATADAAAVAAAVLVKSDLAGGAVLSTAVANAVPTVKDYAQANLGIAAAEWSGCTDPSPLAYTPDASANSDTCISFSTAEVKVVLPARQSPVSFAAIYGHGPITVGAAARAAWAARIPGDCILCVVGDALFTASGDGDGETYQGNVRIGGVLDIRQGSPHGSLTVHDGDLYYGSLADYSRSPTLSSGYSVHVPATFADPFAADTSIHDPWSNPDFPSSPAPATPGYGTCGVDSSGVGYLSASQATSCTGFAPGMYVIYPTSTSDNVVLHGVSSGVLFFLTCADSTHTAPQACPAGGAPGAHLHSSGSTTVTATVTGIAGTSDPLLAGYRGFAVIADPHNTHGQTLDRLAVVGDVYAPGQDVAVDEQVSITGQLVVVGNLTVGQASVTSPQPTSLTVNAPTLSLPGSVNPRVRLVSP